jgi:O-antigen/teichoic acid export membrane protein
MTSEIKKIGKDGIIYGIGIVVSRAASLVMLPIYTRYLTPSDYGAAELLTTSIDVIGMIVGLGIIGAIFKCYADVETLDEKRKVISTSLLMLMVLTLAAMLLGIAFAEPIAGLVFGDRTYSKYFHVIFVTYFVQQGLVSVPLMYIRAIDRPKLFVLIGVIKLAIQIILNLYFLEVLELGLMGILLSSLIGEAIIGGYLLVYSVRHIGFRFSRVYAESIIKLGHPLVITSLSSFVLLYSDRYFLRSYFDLNTLGIYALAYKFGFLLAVLAVVPFQSAWEPQRYRIAKQENGKTVFKRVFLYFNIVVISISVSIVLFVGDVIKIIATPAFWPAVGLVPFVVINAVLQSWTFFCDYGLYHAHRTGRIASSSVIAAAIVVVLNFVLIPVWGVYGAVLATFGAFLVRFGMLFTGSQSYFPIDYGWSKVISLLLLAVFAYLVRSSFGINGIIVSILIDGLTLFAFLVSTYYMILAKSERATIISYLEGRMAALRAG